MLRRMNSLAALCFMIVCTACASVPVEQPAGTAADPQKKELAEQERKRVEKVFAKIRERNSTFKRSPEWLQEAYSGLKIRKVAAIGKQEHASYRRYAADGDVYIVVHPAFYAFFQQDQAKLTSPDDAKKLPLNNLMERYALTVPKEDKVQKIFLEQERLARDFVEFMSQEKKLVILVLPGGYKDAMTYGVVPGVDEYARYINDISNKAESVVYVESQEFSSGYLDEAELTSLAAFLEGVGVKNIMVGGGYIGRCVDNFYISLRQHFGFASIYFVPELLALSPVDQVYDAGSVLANSGRINFRGMIKYLNLSEEIMKQENGNLPQVKRFNLYRVYP